MSDVGDHGPPSAPPTSAGGWLHTPPRCPSCYYRLEGLDAAGACPECGAKYTAPDRFAYAATGGFWRGLWRWTWPVVIGLPALAGSVGVGSWSPSRFFIAPLALIVYGSIAACFVNGVFHSFRLLRRRQLRKSSVTTFAPTLGLYAQSFGCGALVFATSILFGFGISCGALLLMLDLGGIH